MNKNTIEFVLTREETDKVEYVVKKAKLDNEFKIVDEYIDSEGNLVVELEMSKLCAETIAETVDDDILKKKFEDRLKFLEMIGVL